MKLSEIYHQTYSCIIHLPLIIREIQLQEKIYVLIWVKPKEKRKAPTEGWGNKVYNYPTNVGITKEVNFKKEENRFLFYKLLKIPLF